MSIVAGVDIGNSTTEAAIARVGEGDSPEFLSSGSTNTTGIKGTAENISGIVEVLEQATEAAGISMDDLELVLLNEATPVIGDVANTSSRLCGIALAGQIVISEMTRELLGGRFEMEELQPAKVKGKEKPLRIFNVLRLRTGGQVPGIILGDEPTRADG